MKNHLTAMALRELQFNIKRTVACVIEILAVSAEKMSVRRILLDRIYQINTNEYASNRTMGSALFKCIIFLISNRI